MSKTVLKISRFRNSPVLIENLLTQLFQISGVFDVFVSVDGLGANPEAQWLAYAGLPVQSLQPSEILCSFLPVSKYTFRPMNPYRFFTKE